MVRTSEANAAGLEAAAGDSRADGCDAESGAGEHLGILVSATVEAATVGTHLVCGREAGAITDEGRGRS